MWPSGKTALAVGIVMFIISSFFFFAIVELQNLPLMFQDVCVLHDKYV